MIAFLLANWKLVAIGLVVTAWLGLIAALGVQTYRLKSVKAEFKKFELRVEAEGKAAKARAEAIDAHNGIVREEMEHDINTEREGRARDRATRADRFAAVYGKYLGLLNDPGGGGVSQTGAGAAEPVQPLRGCLDAERLVAGIRRDLGEANKELEPLLARGTDGLDDRQHWGRWARLVGACQAP